MVPCQKESGLSFAFLSCVRFFFRFSDARLISNLLSLPLRASAMRELSWHYELNGQPCGPVSETELAHLLQDRIIFPGTRVWREGMPDWAPLEDVWSPPEEPESSSEPQPASEAPPPLPWELQRTPSTAANTLILFLRKPVHAFSRLPIQGSAFPAILFNILFSMLSGGTAVLIHMSVSRLFAENPAPPSKDSPTGAFWELLPQFILLAPLVITASAWIQAGFIHFCLSLLGAARHPFEATFKAVSYVSGTASLFAMIPILGPALLTAWSAFALSVGLAIVHESPWRRAAIAVSIPTLIGFILQLALL
jgi:hypothetical protein